MMPTGRTLLAVSLTRSAPPLELQVAAAQRAGADLVELRLDLIRDHAAVERLLRKPRVLSTILTARRVEEGGAWAADETERVRLLTRLGRLCPGFIDVELASWRRSTELRQGIAPLCRLGESATSGKNELILSHHDPQHTPAEPGRVFAELAASPADVIKAVFRARDALEACRILDLLRQHGARRRVIALATGPGSLLTRVLGRKFGAFLSFAALEKGTEAAASQPTAAELCESYRWTTVGLRTRVFGVIGWPVSHSLSPRLHNVLLAAQQIDAVYLPLPVGPDYDGLARFLDFANDNVWLDFAGASVTLPHKRHAARWLQQHGGTLSETASRCGAVNTMLRAADGSWRGENTDADGFLDALATLSDCAPEQLRGRRADVLGAGGVARAVVAALCQRGAQVTIYNRTASRAAELARRFGCRWAPWEQRAQGTGEILVNCTSVGMPPDVQATPVDPVRLRRETIVVETVYNPPQTLLLRQALERGCRAVPGTEMFVAQAARQHLLWHGRRAPLPLLHQVVADQADG